MKNSCYKTIPSDYHLAPMKPIRHIIHLSSFCRNTHWRHRLSAFSIPQSWNTQEAGYIFIAYQPIYESIIFLYLEIFIRKRHYRFLFLPSILSYHHETRVSKITMFFSTGLELYQQWHPHTWCPTKVFLCNGITQGLDLAPFAIFGGDTKIGRHSISNRILQNAMNRNFMFFC